MTPHDTLLVITPISPTPVGAFTLPPISARGLTQTLQPITGTGSGGDVMGRWVRRDVNGTAHDLSPEQFRKYESVVTCKDLRAPALDGAWLGMEVSVQCASELSYMIGGSPERPVVSGSERTKDHYTFYRPILDMIVVGIENGFDEWPHNYNWKLHLQEK
jgi:hypothetical protein